MFLKFLFCNCILLPGGRFYFMGSFIEISYEIKKARSKFILKSCLSAERAGIRTPDNLIKSQVLYHLSYTPLNWGSWTRTSGAGVRILCLTTWRYPISATTILLYISCRSLSRTFFIIFKIYFLKIIVSVRGFEPRTT